MSSYIANIIYMYIFTLNILVNINSDYIEDLFFRVLYLQYRCYSY